MINAKTIWMFSFFSFVYLLKSLKMILPDKMKLRLWRKYIEPNELQMKLNDWKTEMINGIVSILMHEIARNLCNSAMGLSDQFDYLKFFIEYVAESLFEKIKLQI